MIKIFITKIKNIIITYKIQKNTNKKYIFKLKINERYFIDLWLFYYKKIIVKYDELRKLD